jgi:hypothetical protein
VAARGAGGSDWFEAGARLFGNRIAVEGTGMQDAVYLAATLAFFLIAIAYVRGCARLK